MTISQKKVLEMLDQHHEANKKISLPILKAGNQPEKLLDQGDEKKVRKKTKFFALPLLWNL